MRCAIPRASLALADFELEGDYLPGATPALCSVQLFGVRGRGSRAPKLVEA